MLQHLCLDPHDPYAQSEVMVTYTHDATGLRLIAVIDAQGDDILQDLIPAQVGDLLVEIAQSAPDLSRDSAFARARAEAA